MSTPVEMKYVITKQRKSAFTEANFYILTRPLTKWNSPKTKLEAFNSIIMTTS